MSDAQDIKEIRNHCPSCQSPEQKSIFALLGLRFWDAVYDRQVSDGLVVTAWPETGSSHLTKAFRTSSGNYAFQGLPGLRNFEYSGIRDTLTGSPPRPKQFVIKVIDSERHFLPFSFLIDDLPLPAKGLYQWPFSHKIFPSSPPGGDSSRFFLFSSPTRPVSPGIAVVRAQLNVKDKSQTDKYVAAAYAVMEVSIKEKTWYGISNQSGCVAVQFPYPTSDVTSPPYSNHEPLYKQEWSISVRVRYSETKKTVKDKEIPGRELPNLHEILNQPQVNILGTMQDTAVDELTKKLQYGRELVLKTEGKGSPPVHCSALYIETITSP